RSVLDSVCRLSQIASADLATIPFVVLAADLESQALMPRCRLRRGNEIIETLGKRSSLSSGESRFCPLRSICSLLRPRQKPRLHPARAGSQAWTAMSSSRCPRAPSPKTASRAQKRAIHSAAHELAPDLCRKKPSRFPPLESG